MTERASAAGELGQRLQEIRARLEAATPGPWSAFMGSGNMQCTAIMHEDADGKLYFVADLCPDYALGIRGRDRRLVRGDHIPDMRFIENAPDDIRWLLARVPAGQGAED